MSMIICSRVDQFYEGQVWESPRGTLYRVMKVVRGGQATLRLGIDGKGRVVKRGWDAVSGWYIYSDWELVSE